jgi:hypothetical protein
MNLLWRFLIKGTCFPAMPDTFAARHTQDTPKIEAKSRSPHASVLLSWLLVGYAHGVVGVIWADRISH